jgi:hypothetical protein
VRERERERDKRDILLLCFVQGDRKGGKKRQRDRREMVTEIKGTQMEKTETDGEDNH